MTTPSGAILLGYGGSEHSRIALTWADDLAARLGRPLHVLISALHVAEVAGVAKEHQAGHVTDELDGLLASAKTRETSVSAVLAPPGEALVRAADDAYLTVLGARGQGGLRNVVDGSVVHHVTRHSPGPVVVIREPHAPLTGRIVVGVDGSEHSLAALRFALRHAIDTEGHVLALHVHRQQDDASEKKVEQAIAEASEASIDVRFEVQHAQGAPADKLAEASRGADLLVIGTRGRSAIRAMLPGSVSQSVLQHSACPVVIVR